ncbi:unnamed protein product [Calypogeia fissa]
MKDPRRDFGCGSKDGKIYVFGSVSSHNYMRGCEVYDPNIDSWSSITHMKHKRFDQQVTVFGEEMLVYGGQVDPDGDSGYDARYDPSYVFPNALRDVLYLEVYHPGKDEWRLVKPVQYMGEQRRASSKAKGLEARMVLARRKTGRMEKVRMKKVAMMN